MTFTLLLPKNSFSLIFFCLFLFACKNEKTAEVSTVEADPNLVEIPEDFPGFYNMFHVDPEFQLNHIVFPLEGKAEGVKWTKAEWVIHKPLPHGDDFIREFDNFAGMITETIRDKTNLFFMVRRFAKLGDDWHLIYYEAGNKLSGFDKEN